VLIFDGGTISSPQSSGHAIGMPLLVQIYAHEVSITLLATSPQIRDFTGLANPHIGLCANQKHIHIKLTHP
jgi:hypothetical protein